jgi:hypothetical protein
MDLSKQFRRGAVGLVLTISAGALSGNAQQTPDPDYLPSKLEEIVANFEVCLARHDHDTNKLLGNASPAEVDKIWRERSASVHPFSTRMKDGKTDIGYCTRNYQASHSVPINHPVVLEERGCLFLASEVPWDKADGHWHSFRLSTVMPNPESGAYDLPDGHAWLSINYYPGGPANYVTTYTLSPEGEFWRSIRSDGGEWGVDKKGGHYRIRRLPINPDDPTNDKEFVPERIKGIVLPLLKRLQRACTPGS